MSMFTRTLQCLVVAAAASLTVAQGVPSAPHLSVTQKSAFLLLNPQIRSEVKLSVNQQSAVEKAIQGYNAAQQKLLAASSPSDREIKDVDISFAKKALEAVDATQEKRLLGLTIKQIGVRALKDKEIATRVGLTPAQTKKVDAILAKIAKRNLAFDEMVAKGLEYVEGKDQAEIDRKRTAILKSYDVERVKLKTDVKKLESQAVAALTASQRAKWLALQA